MIDTKDNRNKYYRDIRKHMQYFNRCIDQAIDRSARFVDNIDSKVLALRTANGSYSLYSMDCFKNSFILLRDDGTLKSKQAVSGCMHCSIDGKIFKLENLALKKQDQGQGLGHSMIEFCKDWAQQKECNTLQLEADQNYVFINGQYIHLNAYNYFVKHNMEFKFDKVDDILTYVYTGRIPFKYDLVSPVPYKDKALSDKLQQKQDFEAYDLRNLIYENATKMRR